MMKVKIKYFNPEMPKLEKFDKGDWIDLYIESISIALNHPSSIQKSLDPTMTTTYNSPDGKYWEYEKSNVIIIRLGVAMQLPLGYEAEIKPRSSTFKTTGLIQTNSVSMIDNAYCGDQDEWLAMLYATRDGELDRFDRLVQFRINESMPPIEFEEVEKLSRNNRGGYGTTDL